MIGCGSGNARITKPTSDNFAYSCAFTEEFLTTKSLAFVEMPLVEVALISITLNKGFYTYDFSCAGYNKNLISQAILSIRGYLDFGLGTQQAIENDSRVENHIEIATAINPAFFMTRGGSEVFEVTIDGTILSVTGQQGNVQPDLELGFKVLNVFKVTNYTKTEL